MRVRKLMKTHIEEQSARRLDPLEMCSEGRLGRAEAAKFLDISKDLLDDYLRNGTLPKVKIGRSVGVPKKALIHFLSGRLQYRENLVIVGGLDDTAKPSRAKQKASAA